MIVDAFIFYNEVDLLHMRLEELYPVVDKFVVVQADKTFRGTAKPMYLDWRDEWVAPYRDKLVLIECSIPDFMVSPWDREKYQRNFIKHGLIDIATPDDIVIISDLDEIPRREVVAGLAERNLPVAFEMPHYNYGLNCLFPGTWAAAKALLVRDVTTAEEIRHAQFPAIENAGWHFSYFGDDEFISNKFRSFSHSEVDIPLVHSRIAENRRLMLDPHNHGQQLTVVEIDDTWPHAVRENPERWEKYKWSE